MSRSLRYRRPARLVVEPLEHREVPATLVSPTTLTYQDVDGDNVTVRFSKPLLKAGNVNAVFTFNPGGVFGNNFQKQQLWAINPIGLGSALAGTAITLTATRSLVSGGNGLANVGRINANGIDLAAVVVDGDLGQIDAGDVTTTTRGLASLTVQSMGRFGTTTQAPGGDLISNIAGAIGSITVKSDFNGAQLKTTGGLDARVGTIVIGGSIIGGAVPESGLINIVGDVGSATVGGSLIGGSNGNTGAIYCGGKLGSLTVGGSLIGGLFGNMTGLVASQYGIGTVKIAGDLVGGGWQSGQIFAYGQGATIGSVTIGGCVIGGWKQYSGMIHSNGSIGPITIKGDLHGGSDQTSGSIVSETGNLGPIVIGGSVIGENGQASGAIQSANRIASVVIGGLLRGGLGTNSGRIQSGGDMGPVTVRGSILGGDDRDMVGFCDGSGAIFSNGKIQSVTVGGSVVGGGGYSAVGSAAVASGQISAKGDAGPIRIGGNLLGGQSTGSSGSVQINGKLAGITIGGSVRAGYGDYTGSIGALNMGLVTIGGNLQGGGVGNLSATIDSAGSITGITIGGSLTTGGNSGSGRVLAARNIGPILVKGSLVGTAAAPIIITAGANAIPVGTSEVVIKSLTVNGSVEYANILAGYDKNMGVNADAQIGAVIVGGDWIASNLVAGIDPGVDGKFGTPDDFVINFGQQNPAITASIASIAIKGQVLGSPQAGDGWGFVAQRIGSMSVGGSPISLNPASKDSITLGPTFDVKITEV